MSSEQTQLLPVGPTVTVLESGNGKLHRQLVPGVPACSARRGDTTPRPAADAIKMNPELEWCATCFDNVTEGARPCPALLRRDADEFQTKQWAAVKGFATAEPCARCFPDGEPDGEVWTLPGDSRTHVHDPEGDGA